MVRPTVMLALFAAGCGAVSPVYTTRSPLRPNDAERHVERAFQYLGIPVVERKDRKSVV